MQAKVRLTALILSIFMLSAPGVLALSGTLQSIARADALPDDVQPKDDGAAPLALVDVTFTEVTESVGLWGFNGSTVAWGDYNNDGYQDILVDGKRLFKNLGPKENYNFTDVTSLVGLNSPKPRLGIWGDYDNDGYLDLYVAGGNETVEGDRLFRNTGPDNGWKFADTTLIAGNIVDGHPSGSAGWADYDRDGYLDLFVGAQATKTVGLLPSQVEYTYYENVLWHNNGDGTFTNVTYAAGLNNSASPRNSTSVAWVDFNNDLWPDLYVCNHELRANYFYINTRNGTFDAFEERAMEFGLAGQPNGGPGTFGNSIGAAWGDMDNDGDLDLWVSNRAEKVDVLIDPNDPEAQDNSALYENRGPLNDYEFQNIRASSGIPILEILPPSGPGPLGEEVEEEDFSGVAWGDYDNDGFLDLFIPQMYNNSYDTSFLYRNLHNKTFKDVSLNANIVTYNTSIGAWADYNNDGFLDLLTGGMREHGNENSCNLHLFKNGGNSASWSSITLEGVSSNSAGIGAHVKVTAGTYSYFREVEGGMGSHGMQNSLPLEFGLGEYNGTIDIEVRWPSGIIQRLYDQPMKKFIRIVELAPDLALTSVSFSDSKPLKLQDMRLIANIENHGNYPADSGEVVFYFDKVDSEAVIGTAEINTTIFPGQTGTAFLDWVSGSKEGTFKIYAEIVSSAPREKNLDNNGNMSYITVRKENLVPVPGLSISPTEAIVGLEAITFDARSSYDDNEINAYHFDFGDGSVSGWTKESVVSHLYKQVGVYHVVLQVQDNNYLFSGHFSANVTILRVPNNPPTATINSISPNPVKQGNTITFDGQAFDSDGSILGYVWTSSINGILSDSPVFTMPASDLALGTHTIYFSAYDNEWNVSQYVQMTVEILPSNVAPVAVLDSTPRSIELVGSMLVFKGHGVDSDGHPVAYKWASNRLGLLGTEKYLYVDSLGLGVNYINFTVGDNDGAWSEPVTTVVTIVEGNLAPSARISGITPSIATVGQSVRFAGYGEDDGVVENYLWTSSKNGVIGNTSSFYHDNLSIGLHVITFKVADNLGVWSADVTGELTILPENVPPNATILAVSPANVREGSPVTFTGTGFDVDGSLSAYSWRSSINGYIGSGQSLTVTNLHVGNHTIYFKVRDDRNVWSLEVSGEVTVVQNIVPTPEITRPYSGEKFFVGDIITFDATNTTDGNGDMLSFTWKLGDITIGTKKVFQATLPEGTHTITLTVNDGFGGAVDASVSVVVEKKVAPPPDDIQPDDKPWTFGSFMENVTKGGTETILFASIITLVVASVAAGAVVSRRRRLTRVE